jgi:hypothetical protein
VSQAHALAVAEARSGQEIADAAERARHFLRLRADARLREEKNSLIRHVVALVRGLP